MKVYVVTEEGKYRHHILGVYTAPGAAHDRAVQAAAHSDGYHEYDVNSADEDADIEDVIALAGYKKINGKVERIVKGT